MTEVISVRFRSGCKIYYFSPGQLHIEAGQDVIVETAQGAEYVTCTEGNHPVEDHQVVSQTSRISWSRVTTRPASRTRTRSIRR